MSFTVGQKLTAADLAILDAPPYCDVNSSGVACADGTTTLLTFDADTEDTDNMHDTATNNSRIKLNTAGLYEVRYFVRWPSGMTGNLVLNLRLNSGGSATGGSSLRTTAQAPNASGTSEIERCINYRPVSPGFDYLEVFVQQNSGSSKTCSGGSRVTGAQVRRISS